MKQSVIILIICVLTMESCHEIKPKWQNESFDFSDVKLDTVNVSDFQYFGVKPFIDSIEIIHQLGVPDTIYKQTFKEKKYVSFSYFENKVVIQKIENDFFIAFLNFEVEALTVEIDNVIFNSETSLKQMKHSYPNSYDWRNLGIPLTYGVFEKHDLNDVKYDYLRVLLVDDSGIDIGFLEFSFIDKKLKYLVYDKNWTE